MPACIEEPRKPKKLIVCCDGTWMNSDAGWVNEGWFSRRRFQTPSNVTKIVRAIPCLDSHGSPQVVYYQAGEATGMLVGRAREIIGGATGWGLAEHIRDAYSFLANNYSPGDHIYLIGFSRGAFTVRSVAGLIGQLGLLNKLGLEHFHEIFRDWELAGGPDYEESVFLKYYGNDPSTGEKYRLNVPANEPGRVVEYLREYRALLRKLNLVHKAPGHAYDGEGDVSEDISIQAVACWDTVGALGIPTMPLFQKLLNWPAFLRNKYFRWMDTALTDNILNAFQALALDEHRAPFAPAVWEKPDGCTTNLRQVWFPGAHSGVGGGDNDRSSANITLAWMMDQLSGHSAGSSPQDSSCWIEFSDDYLMHLDDLSNEWYEKHPPLMTWSNGNLLSSFTLTYILAGYDVRNPGRFRKLDKLTCKPKPRVLLRDTNERIHVSVRSRIKFDGYGLVDDIKQGGLYGMMSLIIAKFYKIRHRGEKKYYQPKALKDWKIRQEHEYHDEVTANKAQSVTQEEGQTPWWEWEGDDECVPRGKRLYEDRLGKFELQLLRRSSPAHEAKYIEASNRGSSSISDPRCV